MVGPPFLFSCIISEMWYCHSYMTRVSRDFLRIRGAHKSPLTLLAAAVIKRAFQDLSVCGERGASRIRKEAYDFLTNRLWESGYLWRDLLPGIIHKATLLEAVSSKVAVGKYGEIIPLKKAEK